MLTLSICFGEQPKKIRKFVMKKLTVLHTICLYSLRILTKFQDQLHENKLQIIIEGTIDHKQLVWHIAPMPQSRLGEIYSAPSRTKPIDGEDNWVVHTALTKLLQFPPHVASIGR